MVSFSVAGFSSQVKQGIDSSLFPETEPSFRAHILREESLLPLPQLTSRQSPATERFRT